MRSLKPGDLHAAGEPLNLAAHGSFWTGIERKATPGGTIVAGQAYVEYFIPSALTRPWPILMLHGGGGQGLDYLGTPDGREGWAKYFVRQGYAVYVMDRPGHGRAPFHPDALGEMTPPGTFELLSALFTNPGARPEAYPQARLHNQWPGPGTVEDPLLEAFIAGTGPAQKDMAASHLAAQKAGAEALDKIGPAILMTHSAAGPCGWMIADARPHLVKALVAVEPFGPPFTGMSADPTTLPYGLTAAPLTFDPPLAQGEALSSVERPAPGADLKACRVQAEPARALPNLQGYPIVVVTAQASWMAADNHGTVDVLRQAGADVEHVRLEDQGVLGNGHALMLERNSDACAAVIERWIAGKLETP
ncbi:alpha/beta hydrolase [Sphingobium nicotianae]|nr:alpha/beta hydrolase [Sphingobium nicotianae]